MLPAANPRQSFRNFRAFIGLIQDPDVVVLHDAETQTEPQINASSAPTALQLPPEVWRHIFRYLSVVQLKKVRQVCCSWQQIVDRNQRFLDRIVLRFPIGKTMDENFQLESKMKIPNVAIEQARIISYCSNYPESKQWWTSLAKKLTCLSLTETKICVFELWRMLQQTPQLQELSLMNISFPSYDLTRIVKCNTLRHMRKFTVFSLRYEVIFHFFGEAFPRLKQFKCDNPLDDQDNNEELVRYLKTAQNSLEAIEITGTDAILDTLNTLNKLKLKEVVLLSVDSPLKLLQLVRMHSTITVLIIQSCTLSNTEIAEIGRTLPQLQSFDSCIAPDLNNCWKPTFIHAMPKLQWLSVNNIEHNYPIARFDHDDHECLRALQLYNLQINVPGHLLKFTCNIFDISLVDVKFKSWSDMFDSFQYDMVWSLKLASIKVLNPTENLVCRFRNLQCLELLNLSMDQSLLQTIFELMNKLTAVRLGRLKHACDAVVEVMLMNNKTKLNKISLRNIPISDKVVDFIIGQCRSLELLDIGTCKNISVAAIRRLENCGRFELRSSFEVTKYKP